MRSRSSTTAVALAALALAGCGSSAPSLSAFKSGFARDRTQFRQLGTDLGSEITHASTKTDAQLAAELATLSTRAKQQASQLSQLNPPSQYKNQLGTLVSAFHAVAADLQQISTAAAKNDGATAKTYTVKLLGAVVKVKAGDTALSSALHLPATG
jgi:hypothetical protein